MDGRFAINPYGGAKVNITLHSIMRDEDIPNLLTKWVEVGGHNSTSGRFVDGLGVVEWDTEFSISQLVEHLTNLANSGEFCDRDYRVLKKTVDQLRERLQLPKP